MADGTTVKFELEDYNRGVSDEYLLSDLKRVAALLSKAKLSRDDYRLHGKYNPSTYRNRFGGWQNAVEIAGLQAGQPKNASDEDLLKDLRIAAETLGKATITASEYDAIGKHSKGSYIKRFGSWFNATELAGLTGGFRRGMPEEELFQNLEEVWVKLGRQPHYDDMHKPLSKFSGKPYAIRFGTWRKALKKFVAYINSDETASTEEAIQFVEVEPTTHHKTGRTINWRLRFIVTRRDNFKCKCCGRSPATDPTIILHVDHVLAWAKGGETVLENLQTLCSVCNIGKSDLDWLESDDRQEL